MSDTVTRLRSSPLAVATGVLLLVCVLMVAQKFVRFGGGEHYDLARSMAFNLIVIVPFAFCAIIGIAVRRATSDWILPLRISTALVCGVALIAAYALTISTLVYALGWSSTWPSAAFFSKYASGPLHVHTALFVLLQILPLPQSRQPPPQTKSHAEQIFGLPASNILVIQADDHYVWLRTTTGSVLERTTMRELTEQLPNRFLRVHRSYIVNLDFVHGHKKMGRTIQLQVGDHQVPVSASRRAKVLSELGTP